MATNLQACSALCKCPQTALRRASVNVRYENRVLCQNPIFSSDLPPLRDTASTAGGTLIVSESKSASHNARLMLTQQLSSSTLIPQQYTHK